MPEAGLWDRLVNSKWPKQMPIPTDQEAITGAKRLYRNAMGRPFEGDVKITSGNRHTWIRAKRVMKGRGKSRRIVRVGVFTVNPSYRWRPGWPGIVHSISHYAHQRLHRNDRPHSDRQAYIERDLVDYALANGFHEGKLKRPEKPKPDAVMVKYQRILARQKSWETKLERAQKALIKVNRERRQYERRHEERLGL